MSDSRTPVAAAACFATLGFGVAILRSAGARVANAIFPAAFIPTEVRRHTPRGAFASS